MSEPSLSRRAFLASTGLAAFAGPSLARAGSAWAAPAAKVGTPAPEFSAVATTGKTVSLADYADKIVMVEGKNHECPYVRKHYETRNIQALQEEATAQGVIWLSIIASAPNEQGYGSESQADELT